MCHDLASLTQAACGEGCPGYVLAPSVTIAALWPVPRVGYCAFPVKVCAYYAKPRWYNSFMSLQWSSREASSLKFPLHCVAASCSQFSMSIPLCQSLMVPKHGKWYMSRSSWTSSLVARIKEVASLPWPAAHCPFFSLVGVTPTTVILGCYGPSSSNTNRKRGDTSSQLAARCCDPG